jgi:hypothetical protein
VVYGTVIQMRIMRSSDSGTKFEERQMKNDSLSVAKLAIKPYFIF